MNINYLTNKAGFMVFNEFIQQHLKSAKDVRVKLTIDYVFLFFGIREHYIISIYSNITFDYHLILLIEGTLDEATNEFLKTVSLPEYQSAY